MLGSIRAPVECACRAQRRHVVRAERRHGDAAEQAAVEPGDVVHAEQAAVLHRLEQRLQLRAQPRRLDAHADQPLEQPLRQQADVLGKEAEQALRQEVADLAARHAGAAQPLGGGGEGARRLLGDVAVAARRAEALRVGPQCAQQLLRFGLRQLLERDHMALARRAGEVGVDLDALAIAHDEQRRALQWQRVHHQLAQRAFKAAAPAPCIPRRSGPSARRRRSRRCGRARCRCASRRARSSRRSRIARLGHAEQAAQVDEVRLRAGPFVEPGGRSARLPLGDELACRQRHWPSPRRLRRRG